jgi:carbonic anhydrase
MEFACDVAGAKLVVVMGHTACGAVKGAIDNVLLGHLSGLIAKIQPAILETSYQGDRASGNQEFVDLVARTHVSMAVKQIQQDSPVLRTLATTGAIKIVGCMYDLRTARIALL